jgi:hypothetical protein
MAEDMNCNEAAEGTEGTEGTHSDEGSNSAENCSSSEDQELTAAAEPAEEANEVGHADPVFTQIENAFTYHPPKPGQADKYNDLRAEAKNLAISIALMVPAGRERSTAFTKLEECIMHANAGIARN